MQWSASASTRSSARTIPPVDDIWDGMSTSQPNPQELLDRLDARHDELIERLDELNGQIERALSDLSRSRAESMQRAA